MNDLFLQQTTQHYKTTRQAGQNNNRRGYQKILWKSRRSYDQKGAKRSEERAKKAKGKDRRKKKEIRRGEKEGRRARKEDGEDEEEKREATMENRCEGK